MSRTAADLIAEERADIADRQAEFDRSCDERGFSMTHRRLLLLEARVAVLERYHADGFALDQQTDDPGNTYTRDENALWCVLDTRREALAVAVCHLEDGLSIDDITELETAPDLCRGIGTGDEDDRKRPLQAHGAE